MITLRLRERNWMPKFEACSRIRKRLITIWIFPYICFDFRCAGETQTEKCMEKLKLWLEAFVCGYMPQILVFSLPLITSEFSIHNFRILLEIFDAEFPYKLLLWATLPTEQNGGENREKVYCVCFDTFKSCSKHLTDFICVPMEVPILRLLFSLKPKEMAKMRFLAIWIDQK